MKSNIQIQVDAALQWQVSHSVEDGYVAVCDSLALTMYARSLDALESRINEAIQLLLTDLLEEGDLDSFLNTRGWQARPLPNHDGNVHFDVPYQLLVNYGNDKSRQVYQ